MAPRRGPVLPPIDRHAAAPAASRGAPPTPRRPSGRDGSPPHPAETPTRGLFPCARPLAPAPRAPALQAAPPSAACIRFRADTAGPPPASPVRRPDTPPPAQYRAWPTSPPGADLPAVPFAAAATTPAPSRLRDAARE